jgi:hypothetical protein
MLKQLIIKQRGKISVPCAEIAILYERNYKATRRGYLYALLG